MICPLTAQLLYKLGAKDLAWEYLNTPLAIFPPDAEGWSELAKALVKQEDFELAALAYEQAFEAEPGNAQMLWDWAQALDRAGKANDAQQLYRRLADGSWAPSFQGIQTAAKRQLQARPK